MTDHELAMLPVRERSEASAEVRVYQAPYSRPVEALVTRFNVFAVDEYLAMGPTLVRAADAPAAARVSVEVSNAYGVEVPYRPEDYVYRTVDPLMRWVPSSRSLEIRANGTVSQWYALPSAVRTSTIRCNGDIRVMLDEDASVPQYVYRSANGLVGVQALSIGRGGSMTMPLEVGPSGCAAVAVVGMFDRSSTSPFPIISIGASGDTRASIGIDTDDSVQLVVDSEITGSARNPFKPGTLFGAMLSVNAGEVRAGVWTTDGYEAMLSSSIGMMGDPFVDAAVIAGSDRPCEIVEAVLMDRSDGVLLRGQMSETLSYYATRRPR